MPTPKGGKGNAENDGYPPKKETPKKPKGGKGGDNPKDGKGGKGKEDGAKGKGKGKDKP